MNGRRWLVVVLSSMLVVVAQAQPPVHKVDDHWSAWNPPAAAPEGTQIYVVQTGDTLWDLAQRFLGDPHLWPQIWENNRYVADAQWIYPGDPLLLPATSVAATAGVAGPPISEPPGVGMPSEENPYTTEPPAAAPPSLVDTSAFTTQPGGAASEAPVPLGYEADIYCSGFVGKEHEEFPYSVAASEYEFLYPQLDTRVRADIRGVFGKSDTQKYLLGIGDIVYVKGGRDEGLSAGMLLTAVKPEYRVLHPLNHKQLGRFYQYLARIRVLSVQSDTAIGEIIMLCDPVSVGTQLKPFEPEPVPLRRLTPLRPVNYPASNDEVAQGATIIASRDRLVALGAGHLVFIDRGESENVAPGDIYTIYRPGRKGYPPLVLGEAAVLSVYENSALARILRSRYTIFVGDNLVLK